MTAVKVGQTWRDKDKRRSTVIEIIDTFKSDAWGGMALGLVVGTEEEREYRVDRLVKRWELVKDAPEEILVLPAGKDPWSFKGTWDIVAGPDHVHNDRGECLKNRLGPRCNEPKPESVKQIKTVTLEPAPVETTEKITREHWLEKAVDLLKEGVFKKYDVPTVRVSVGWPRRAREATIGQCFVSKVSEDKSSQVFISPVLADPIKVLETLAHEIVHAVDDCESGHRARFKTIAREIGLEGKLTATHAGDALRETLVELSEELGEYPHAKISIEDRPKVQKTYMLKVACVKDDEFFVRMTQSKLDDFGFPICPCHKEEMELSE